MHTGHVGNIYCSWNFELFVKKLSTVNILLRKSQVYALWRTNDRKPDFMNAWVKTRTCSVPEPYS